MRQRSQRLEGRRQQPAEMTRGPESQSYVISELECGLSKALVTLLDLVYKESGEMGGRPQV